MPAAEIVKAFVADVVSGDHVGAIERWYAEDASMRENQGEPRVGREGLMAREAATLAHLKRVDTECLAPPLIDGDTVVIRWRFTFIPHEGAPRTMEEVAWQTWSANKIHHETFFYDPGQLLG